MNQDYMIVDQNGVEIVDEMVQGMWTEEERLWWEGGWSDELGL